MPLKGHELGPLGPVGSRPGPAWGPPGPMALFKVNGVAAPPEPPKRAALTNKSKGSRSGFVGQVLFLETPKTTHIPEMSGFSRANLFYMKKFYVFFGEKEKIPQAVGQIPWGHVRLILDKIKNLTEAEFYINKTIENSWSRAILQHQIELNLFARKGKLQSNFENTVSLSELNLIQESFKESYIFDFLNLSQKAKEKDLEKALIEHISHLLLEFGRGFAFVGKQYKIVVGDDEFFIDLLFYNYILKRFVVIELKITDFKPEYIGQIGFYMTAVDKQIKTETDKETIGLIICKSKNKTVVEYALANSDRPTGVAEYKLTQLPAEIAEVLPDEEAMLNFNF